jgi:hypothetical protein
VSKIDFFEHSGMIYITMLEKKEEELLQHTYEVEKENNVMLKKLYHDMWWGRMFRMVYWVVVFGAMFGAYYYVQPYIDPIFKAYSDLSGMMESVKGKPTQ